VLARAADPDECLAHGCQFFNVINPLPYAMTAANAKPDVEKMRRTVEAALYLLERWEKRRAGKRAELIITDGTK